MAALSALIELLRDAIQQGRIEAEVRTAFLDVQAAEQQLGKARGPAPSAEIAGWTLDIEGRIGLIRGRGAEAAEHLRQERLSWPK